MLIKSIFRPENNKVKLVGLVTHGHLQMCKLTKSDEITKIVFRTTFVIVSNLLIEET
jgi:hypothetical protein